MQLGKEQQEMGEKYKQKSIAEQNSSDLAWDLLMDQKYADLRNILFVTRAELLRFRQVSSQNYEREAVVVESPSRVLSRASSNYWAFWHHCIMYQVLVNVVLATDIFDKELNGLRKNVSLDHVCGDMGVLLDDF